MANPSFWMLLVAAGLLLVGLLHGRSRRGYPPVWVCSLLVLGALLGVWFLLNAQFGGQVLQIHLP
ncbi:MAG TPA: hypothetical protein VFV38_46930 [Ktedonobacteraceae bacterium]|nr:hypothetical protein [Ktedonobacteraceae bacterium]